MMDEHLKGKGQNLKSTETEAPPVSVSGDSQHITISSSRFSATWVIGSCINSRHNHQNLAYHIEQNLGSS
jgi:hypothetical protein